MSTDDEVLGKAYDARLMRRLLQYLRPYWRQVALAFVTLIVSAVASLIQPYLIKVAIDRYITQRQLAGLDGLAALYLTILVASFGAEYFQTWTLQLTGQRIMYDLRMAIYRHLQRLDLRYYDRNPVGRLMTRVTSDVDVLNDLFTSGVVTIFGDVFTLVGIMGVMLWMNWRLALVAFSVLPLIFFVTQWFRRNVRESYRTVRGLIARINAFLQENITGMTTVQLFRRERMNFARFDTIDREHRDANIDSIFYYAVFYPAIEVVSTLATSLIIWYGGGSVIQKTLTLGALVAFVQYSQRFFRPISDMSEKFNVMQSAMASSERIFKLLDEPVAIQSPASPRKRPAPALGHIRFEGVWFAYNAEREALRDTGHGGHEDHARRVLCGGELRAELDPQGHQLRSPSRRARRHRGRHRIGKNDAHQPAAALLRRGARPHHHRRHRYPQLDLADVRGLFSLVLQDVHLFSGTVADNIRLGNQGISDERVRSAARAVHAEPFIARMPAGYASAIAERGATLSVGQKQLLSFARALAFDPRVLVLDEATSSVDTDTELIIRDALRVLMADRTTIAIAHRLSTIQDMDKILVLHKGQLRESGTHQELLAQRGIYYKLFELQYREDGNLGKVEVRSEKLEVEG